MKKALVTSVEGDDVFVMPLIKSECASCAAGCDKRGNAFAVANPRKFPVKAGDAVRLGMSSVWQNIRGLIALLFPFCSAVAGYFLAPFVASLFGKTAGDGWRALCVLVFLGVASGIVLLLTRGVSVSGKNEILEVLDRP